MYKLCKTEQSAARQRQLELGLQAYMLTMAYEDISISDLCEYLQIPRKSFYRYFNSKDGALCALVDHTMMEFYESNLREKRNAPQDDLERFFTFWYARKSLLSALVRSNLSGILTERATMLACSERMMPQSVLSWKTDRQGLAMNFAISGLMSMVLQWHKSDYQLSPQEIAQISAVMLMQPLIQQK